MKASSSAVPECLAGISWHNLLAENERTVGRRSDALDVESGSERPQKGAVASYAPFGCDCLLCRAGPGSVRHGKQQFDQLWEFTKLDRQPAGKCSDREVERRGPAVDSARCGRPRFKVQPRIDRRARERSPRARSAAGCIEQAAAGSQRGGDRVRGAIEPYEVWGGSARSSQSDRTLQRWLSGRESEP